MAYHRMSNGEQIAFLRDGARPAVLCTVRADGQPHSAPVWFDLDGETVVFNTGAKTVKGRNLAGNPRASLCVQDDRPPYAFVLLEGTVTLVDDLAEVRKWATRIGGRYMGPDRAEEFGARNGVPGEWLVRLTAERHMGAIDLA
jgi:PPOX class probable F420-dependent enzyme